jgi:hypothetical protein
VVDDSSDEEKVGEGEEEEEEEEEEEQEEGEEEEEQENVFVTAREAIRGDVQRQGAPAGAMAGEQGPGPDIEISATTLPFGDAAPLTGSAERDINANMVPRARPEGGAMDLIAGLEPPKPTKFRCPVTADVYDLKHIRLVFIV